jgi:hypothetical protein
MEFVGGGGEDHRSINFLCELLLQFSFSFGSDEKEIVKKPVCIAADVFQSIPELLESLLRLPNERNVPIEITQLARLCWFS